jgi:Fe2+ transport system protein FeoA
MPRHPLLQPDHRRHRYRHGNLLTLADVFPGKRALIAGLGDLPAEQIHRLQAYGILPGRLVRVLMNRPMIIVQVEQTELALEESIARQIFIAQENNLI